MTFNFILLTSTIGLKHRPADLSFFVRGSKKQTDRQTDRQRRCAMSNVPPSGSQFFSVQKQHWTMNISMGTIHHSGVRVNEIAVVHGAAAAAAATSVQRRRRRQRSKMSADWSMSCIDPTAHVRRGRVQPNNLCRRGGGQLFYMAPAWFISTKILDDDDVIANCLRRYSRRRTRTECTVFHFSSLEISPLQRRSDQASLSNVLLLQWSMYRTNGPLCVCVRTSFRTKWPLTYIFQMQVHLDTI